MQILVIFDIEVSAFCKASRIQLKEFLLSRFLLSMTDRLTYLGMQMKLI